MPMTHTAELREVHVVRSIWPATVSARAIAGQHAEVRQAQLRIAQAWASSHGLEVEAHSDCYGTESGDYVIETTWVVTVGKGDIDVDQDPPGSLDRWRWSARVGHWRGLLQGLGREGRRLAVREDGLAQVHRLRPTVYNFPDVPEGTDLVSTPEVINTATHNAAGEECLTGDGRINLDREFTEEELRNSPYTGLFDEASFPPLKTTDTPRDDFTEATRRFIEPTRPYLPGTGPAEHRISDFAAGEQSNQSGYLPGTGPAEHRPAWLQSDNVAGEVGGDWSNT